MEEEVIEKYKKAGEIAKKIKELAREIIKENAKTLDVAEKLEKEIKHFEKYLEKKIKEVGK